MVRPIGFPYFGLLGDRKGRRTSLIASVTLMGLAGFVTGLLPGYAQIGVWAPILLVLMPTGQGPSPPAARSAAPPATSGNGHRPSAAPVHLLHPQRRPELAKPWPPASPLSRARPGRPGHGILGLADPVPARPAAGRVCLDLRLQVEDSPEFVEAKAREHYDKPVKDLFTNYRAPLLKVILIATVQTIGTLVGTVYISVYFSNVLGFSKGTASTVVLLAVLLAAVLIPFAGRRSNWFGGNGILAISFAAYALITLPAFLLMNQGVIGLAMAGFMHEHDPLRPLPGLRTYAVMPEFFPVEVRHTGVAFGSQHRRRHRRPHPLPGHPPHGRDRQHLRPRLHDGPRRRHRIPGHHRRRPQTPRHRLPPLPVGSHRGRPQVTMTAIYVSDSGPPDVLAVWPKSEPSTSDMDRKPSVTTTSANRSTRSCSAPTFTAEMISGSPRLKIIARHGVGSDNVDIPAATEHGVWVTVTPGQNSQAVAEHVFALALALARKVVPAATATRAVPGPP